MANLIGGHYASAGGLVKHIRRLVGSWMDALLAVQCTTDVSHLRSATSAMLQKQAHVPSLQQMCCCSPPYETACLLQLLKYVFLVAKIML